MGEEIRHSGDQATKNKNDKRNKTIAIAGLVVFVFFLMMVAGILILANIGEKMNSTSPQSTVNKEISGSQEVTKTEAPKDMPQEDNKIVEQKTVEEVSPVKRIEAIVKKITDKSEITIWDTKGNFAKETTDPPYEVIVNAGKGDIASCDFAKNVAFEIMKNLYSDEAIKDKIARVLFTSWGQLRVSVGSEDGTQTNWAVSGPTNFWIVMMKYKPYEDETGPMSQRTWGKEIASDCD